MIRRRVRLRAAGAIWTDRQTGRQAGARVLMNSAARRREIGRYDTILGQSVGRPAGWRNYRSRATPLT